MASAWFQPDYYFNNLLDQKQAAQAGYSANYLVKELTDAGYTIAGSTAADIAAAADQFERNFNDEGNLANVSPNGYFDIVNDYGICRQGNIGEHRVGRQPGRRGDFSGLIDC